MVDSTSADSFSTGPNAIALPICAALVIIANFVPIVLLARAKKVAACTMIVVLSVQNAFSLINAIVWPNDKITTWYSGVGLCDLQVALKAAMSTLLATSSAYLAIDLAKAIDTDNPRLYESAAMRRRRLILEVVFCFAIPLLQIPLHYIVQASRFGVVTVYGCADFVDDSWPMVVLLAMWPPIFALVNCYYAILVMHRLRKHRGVLSRTLSSTGSGLNSRRFLKLFFLSFSLLLVYLPVTLYFFYLNLDSPFNPFSWSRIHNPASWQPIIFITTAMMPRLQYDNWVGIVMASFSFFLYGMNNEGIDMYKGWLVKCGLLRIFPNLLQPRERLRRGDSSRGSWASRLDVVSRAAIYLDGARKGNESSSLNTSISRKGSGTTLEHINSPGDRFISASTTVDVELTGSTPSSSKVAAQPAAAEIKQPQQVHQPGSILSPFRTQFTLGFPTFALGPKKHATTASTSSLESQTPPTDASLDNSFSSVETSIWSSTDELDPKMPRMGTRAYREWEKREHQRAGSSRGVLPDTITIDFAPTCGPPAGAKIDSKSGERE